MYPHYLGPNGARGMITFGPFGLHMHELDTTGHMPLAAAAGRRWLAGWLVHWTKNNIVVER